MEMEERLNGYSPHSPHKFINTVEFQKTMREIRKKNIHTITINRHECRHCLGLEFLYMMGKHENLCGWCAAFAETK